MTDDAALPSSNDAYLAAALHWLRLRLDAYTAEHRAEPAETAAPAPRRGRRRTVEERPALSPAAGPSGPLAEAEAAVRAAERAVPTPALVGLADLLGLSRFERDVVLLCAAMELDPDTAARCADAHGDPALACPTFALALRALPDPAWDALSPHGPLRRWRLIEIGQPAGRPLVTSPLRADERIVHHIKGLSELDSRLEPLLTRLVARPGLLPAAQHPAALALRAAASDTGVVVQLLGPDRNGKELFAAAATDLLYRLPADALPTNPADLENLARLWSREALLLGASLYVDADDHETPEPLVRFVRRVEGGLFLGTREPRDGLDRPTAIVDVGRPSRAEQRAAWAETVPAESADALAGQFDLGLPAIDHISRTVPGTDANALWAACLAHTRPRLDALAQRIEPRAD
ncbi:hypothetical protein [Streptomyces chartreusis]